MKFIGGLALNDGVSVVVLTSPVLIVVGMGLSLRWKYFNQVLTDRAIRYFKVNVYISKLMDGLLHGSRLTKNPLQCKGFVCVG